MKPIPPITGITSMGQVLFEKYKKLTEKQRLEGLEEIAKSSERLTTLVNNLIDLSKLSSMKYELNKKKVNLSYLVYSSLDACTKMYLNGKELEFVTNIEDNITVTCDEYYIKQTLDNLIINAISYPEGGPITVNLKRDKDTIEFSIQDEGIGIPIEELIRIFAPFTVSSKTRTPASSRDICLALCEKVIKLHSGAIKAGSDGMKGLTFRFSLLKLPTSSRNSNSSNSTNSILIRRPTNFFLNHKLYNYLLLLATLFPTPVTLNRNEY